MTKDVLNQFLENLRRARWNIATKPDNFLDLSAAFLARYPRIPSTYLDFLRHVSECSNPEQTAWFLCVTDYNENGNDDTAFRWNEWERIGLEAAEGDEEIIHQITDFWDCHLPIMSAVHSDYAYLSISLAAAEYGTIVYGYGPEFEESAKKVCNSFGEFLNIFGRIIKGEISAEYQSETGERLTRREFTDFL